MAEAVKETEKELVALPWEATALNASLYTGRRVKMVKPVCESCQKSRRRNWVKDCKHNPYVTTGIEPMTVPKIECGSCGQDVAVDAIAPECHPQAEMLVTGEAIRKVRVARPRIIEVALSMSNNSGQGVELARRKGCKYPHELGFQDMCQFSGCYAPSPQVRTVHGDYCSKDHAALVALNEQGEAIEVLNHEKMRIQRAKVGL